MRTMTSSAKQLDQHIEGHLEKQASSEVDPQVNRQLNSQISGQLATGGAQPLGQIDSASVDAEKILGPLSKLALSPDLRAAVAIGFFLAYLATALS